MKMFVCFFKCTLYIDFVSCCLLFVIFLHVDVI